MKVHKFQDALRTFQLQKVQNISPVTGYFRVAALSQTLLNQGNQFCFLFTDLANPTSNHIYQEIGYQPVGDWQEYSFVSDFA